MPADLFWFGILALAIVLIYVFAFAALMIVGISVILAGMLAVVTIILGTIELVKLGARKLGEWVGASRFEG